jgi:protein-disulfide isomerase
MTRAILLLLFAAAFVATGCEKKIEGFGLEGSPIRFKTKKFEDKETLAVAAGQTFTKGQILDKSPVLKDLEEQENEAVVALAYMKVVERLPQGTKPLGFVEIYTMEPKVDLAKILNRFDRTPVEGLGVKYLPASNPDLIAQYKDIKVARDELPLTHVVVQSIEQRRYREIASQLNSQMTRILLGDQANKTGQDLQAFLNKEVFAGKDIQVSDSELYAYLSSIGFAREELTEELKPRFVEAMKLRKQQEIMEEYVAKNILKGPIEVAFSEPATKLPLNDNWTPVMGYKDAPIALVAFSAVNCPDCSPFIDSLRAVMKKYDGHLKLNWIHTFNENDGIARMMAEASLCVESVKHGKSVDFLNEFSAKSGQVDENSFYAWAGKNGVNPESLKKCFLDKGNETLITQHLDYARRTGIVANPTLWVEGRTLQGVISKDQLEKLVEDTIQTKGSSWWKAYLRRFKAMIFG